MIDHTFADLTVMGDVNISHQEAVITDGGETFFGGSMNGGIFPYGNPVADFGPGGLAFVR